MSVLKDVEYIVGTGYYTEEDESMEEVNPHTKETKDLYEKGFNLFVDELDPDNLDDVYNGVFPENDGWLAEAEINGKTVYKVID